MTASDPQLGVRRRQKVRNVAQGLLLLAALLLLGVSLAWWLYGPETLPWVLAGGLLVGLTQPRVPARWVLSSYGAQPMPRALAPQLHRIVDVLAERAELPAVPSLYYVPTQTPNAFAVGHGQEASLGVTDGLLRLLGTRELAGVLAHEISHVRNGDTRIMALSDLIGRFVRFLARVGLWSVVLTVPFAVASGDPSLVVVSAILIATPAVVALLQLALSRSRELDADLDGAILTGDPEGLARGLLLLEGSTGRTWERAGASPARTHSAVLLSHPPTAVRVERLRQLVPQQRPASWADESAVPAVVPEMTRPPRLRMPRVRW